MKNNLFKILGTMTITLGLLTSCNKDLDLRPTNDITADVAYGSMVGYKQALAKVYGSYALTGSGGAGSSDLGGIDAGQSDFLRLFWNAQELTTDEALWVWNDEGFQDLNLMSWTSSNILLRGLYTRSLYQITVSNEFLRESTNEKLNSRGITGADADQIRKFRAEARFLRAFQYWVLMDLFGNPPFVTEETPIGKFLPSQIKRAELFNYVESELKEIEPLMVAPKQNEYGRADQAAVWALLARMYLNAEVYLGAGKGRYTDAITYADKVVKAGFTLAPQYQNLFLADNNLNNPEVILSINYDGNKTQNWGGTTAIINAAVQGDDPTKGSAFGVPGGGWGACRSRDNLPLLFPDHSGNTDKRAMFRGSKVKVDEIAQFRDGLAVSKFKNVTSTGVTAPSTNGSFSSTDFPLFRLAEMYLIYAEAVKRGGTGGTEATAISYLNLLRERAFGDNSGNISTYTLDYILDERGREFYWEGFRRTDLIRYGRYTTSNYLWPFKGGVKAGRAVEDFRNLFPIPATDIISNPKLTQNTGY